MDTDTGTDPRDLTGLAALSKPKKPRKPAAKKAAKAKKAKKARKVTKTKAKKSAKRPKVMAAVARSERLDLRLSKPEKAKVTAKAQKLRRTVTSIVIEAIERIK